jgi:Tfp pilus assembly protein PilP
MWAKPILRIPKQWLGGLLLIAFISLCGCGDDAEEQKQPWVGTTGDALEAKVKKKKKKRGQVDIGDFKAKAEWDMIAPHFFKYVSTLEEELHAKSVTWKYKDAFADRAEKFFPPEESEKASLVNLKAVKTAKSKEKTAEEKTIESILAGIVEPELDTKITTPDMVDDGPKQPLIRYSLDSYNFRIIMTGVSNPEVLVEDPDGITHVVHLNDKIGSEGGYVADIFKNQVLVRVPDQPEPLTVSLSPKSLPDSFATN